MVKHGIILGNIISRKGIEVDKAKVDLRNGVMMSIIALVFQMPQDINHQRPACPRKDLTSLTVLVEEDWK